MARLLGHWVSNQNLLLAFRGWQPTYIRFKEFCACWQPLCHFSGRRRRKGAALGLPCTAESKRLSHLITKPEPCCQENLWPGGLRAQRSPKAALYFCVRYRGESLFPSWLCCAPTLQSCHGVPGRVPDRVVPTATTVMFIRIVQVEFRHACFPSSLCRLPNSCFPFRPLACRRPQCLHEPSKQRAKKARSKDSALRVRLRRLRGLHNGNGVRMPTRDSQDLCAMRDCRVRL